MHENRGRPEVPEHCPQPDRPCQWERERADIAARLGRMESHLSEIHAALAVGSERFKNQSALSDAIKSQEEQIKALSLSVATLAQTVGVLRTIVYGGVGFTLITVLGALLALIITKGAA